jgi:hypothetical protein
MIHAAAFLVSLIAGRLWSIPPTQDAATLRGWPAAPSDSLPATLGPYPKPSGFVRQRAPSDTIPPSRRPRAIEYSDWYYRRLTMHRVASYAEFPLFGAEYILGEQLLHDERHGTQPSGLVTAHVLVASGLGTLFAFNTVTGGWNLWESRKDPAGRTRRVLHSVLMLVADGGFFATALAGGNAKHNISNAELHRNLAVASMGVGAAGTIMMWVWRN